MNIWNLDCICRVHCKINSLTNFGSLNYWLEVAFMKYNNNNNNSFPVPVLALFPVPFSIAFPLLQIAFLQPSFTNFERN